MTISIRSIEEPLFRDRESLRVVQPIPQPPLHLVSTQGQIQIHTGQARGSFSGVLSEAIRSAGLGSRVLVAQLLRGGVNQGPTKGISLCGRLNWVRPDFSCCITESMLNTKNSNDYFLQKIQAIWDVCKEQLSLGVIEKLVIDEIGLAIRFGYIEESDLIATLQNKPCATDIILTGPSIPNGILEMADQVTELR